MMCYKDRTFCNFWGDCIYGVNCDKALTDDVRAGSKISGLPIAQYVSPPECYKEQKLPKSDFIIKLAKAREITDRIARDAKELNIPIKHSELIAIQELYENCIKSMKGK